MRAVETTGKIDGKGVLHLSKPLKEKDKKVKVIVLFPESGDETEERIWMEAISKNPAFDFLKDPAEDIYSSKDGKPLNGKK